jgi:hypothetical protein
LPVSIIWLYCSSVDSPTIKPRSRNWVIRIFQHCQAFFLGDKIRF